jgi:RimJ/RimL family protein N-acetyltransferase
MAKIHEGQRVRIRPIEEADLDVFESWRRDSDSLGGFNPPVLKSAHRARAGWTEDQFLTPEYSLYAVETLEGDRLVGKVGFSKDSPHYDHMVRTYSQIADPTDRGQGYATEARVLLVNYLFLSTQLERIYSETEEGNAPARRSLEKCGMRCEGVHRHLVYDVGRWADMAVYAILRAEWASSDLYAPYREPFTRPWTEKKSFSTRLT